MGLLDEVSVLFGVVLWVSWVGSVLSIFINSLAVCWAVSLVRWKYEVDGVGVDGLLVGFLM